MQDDILNIAREFLITYMDDKAKELNNQYENWWSSHKYTIQHSLRVGNYADKIIKLEKGIKQEDIVLIRLAAILHDIGKVETEIEHSICSAEIVKKIFIPKNRHYFSKIDDEKLIDIIKKHSDKKNRDNDICSNILKDADILDETGVMSIFINERKLNQNSPFYYNELLERLKTSEMSFLDKTSEILYTKTAKEILNEKKSFLEKFVLQFEEELVMSSENTILKTFD
ncbi:MAG TPA: hypothetical protein DEP72_09430 [Clostridiales bacterium]|nr:MAG: hypothetical protein A2Y18_04040 [Clostridiales bacterium GWD2_32_19]HCC08362.1 hypothetical protein [Clostridiales bacterium]